MALVWEHRALRLREIGELFGGLDYAAVAQRIRRVKKANPARLKNLVKEMLNVRRDPPKLDFAVLDAIGKASKPKCHDALPTDGAMSPTRHD